MVEILPFVYFPAIQAPWAWSAPHQIDHGIIGHIQTRFLVLNMFKITYFDGPFSQPKGHSCRRSVDVNKSFRLFYDRQLAPVSNCINIPYPPNPWPALSVGGCLLWTNVRAGNRRCLGLVRGNSRGRVLRTRVRNLPRGYTAQSDWHSAHPAKSFRRGGSRNATSLECRKPLVGR